MFYVLTGGGINGYLLECEGPFPGVVVEVLEVVMASIVRPDVDWLGYRGYI